MIYSFISLPFCPDPDPDPQIYADSDPDPGRAKTCGSGSETLSPSDLFVGGELFL